MYQTGLAASAKYIVDEELGYICPLCLSIVRNPSDLSQEHVPPQAVGGRVLCLLCKNCNNRAGHSIDAAMAERVAAKKVLSEGTRKKFVDLKFDDVSVRAKLLRTGTHGEFSVPQKYNNPDHLKEFCNRIQEPQNSTSFEVWYQHQFNDHYAMVGYLKAAYLYAFANFGYGYILQECMDLVRNQIRAPKQKVIWKWWLARREELDHAKLYLCETPINCLAVGIFEHIIVLPGFREPFDQYERVRALTKGKSPDRLVGKFQFSKSFPAPTRMELLCETIEQINT